MIMEDSRSDHHHHHHQVRINRSNQSSHYLDVSSSDDDDDEDEEEDYSSADTTTEQEELDEEEERIGRDVVRCAKSSQISKSMDSSTIVTTTRRDIGVISARANSKNLLHKLFHREVK